MGESKLDLLQGTLDLMVLQTLTAMGEMHGYGIARRIEEVSGDEVLLNQGTIYASLVRLQQTRVDRGGVGDVGEQPEGEVLFDYEAGQEAVGGGCGLLGAVVGRDGAGAGDGQRRR